MTINTQLFLLITRAPKQENTCERKENKKREMPIILYSTQKHRPSSLDDSIATIPYFSASIAPQILTQAIKRSGTMTKFNVVGVCRIDQASQCLLLGEFFCAFWGIRGRKRGVIMVLQ